MQQRLDFICSKWMLPRGSSYLMVVTQPPLLFIKGGSKFEFPNFPKREGASDFSPKNGGVDKTRGLF